MKSKKLIAAFSVCALLLVTAGVVHANPFTHNRSHYGNTYNVSPEKSASLEKSYDASEKRIQPLQDDLFAKRLELDALAQNPNTKPETISKLTKEISSLRAEIRTEREKLNEQIQEETGIRNNAPYYNNGYRGHRGGHGGNYRGGHGGGCSW